MSFDALDPRSFTAQLHLYGDVGARTYVDASTVQVGQWVRMAQSVVNVPAWRKVARVDHIAASGTFPVASTQLHYADDSPYYSVIPVGGQIEVQP